MIITSAVLAITKYHRVLYY